LKIQFKGRVNRWRRTKSIIGFKKTIPLHTIDTCIEYGTSKAVTKKGSLGIRLWLYYKLSFVKELKNKIFNFMAYSKYLHLESIERFVNKFNSVNDKW
jgi:ribosomal protein S3